MTFPTYTSINREQEVSQSYVCSSCLLILFRLIGKPVNRSAISSGSFLESMVARKKKVIVFYGSQTGTAEEFATRLAKDANRIGMPAIAYDPEDATSWVSKKPVPRSVL